MEFVDPALDPPPTTRSRLTEPAAVRRSLISIFTRDAHGRRPVYGGIEKFQTDPSGAISSCSTNTSTAIPVPASGRRTETGWTGLVASLIDEWRR